MGANQPARAGGSYVRFPPIADLCCISHETCTKTRALKINRFSGAQIWCKFAPMIYGYARVSTDGQSVAAQVAELTAAGAVKVFRETASGAQTDRAQLRKALAALEADDVLIV